MEGTSEKKIEFPYFVWLKVKMSGHYTKPELARIDIENKVMRFNNEDQTKVHLHHLHKPIHWYKRRGLNRSTYKMKFTYKTIKYKIEFGTKAERAALDCLIEQNYVSSQDFGQGSSTNNQSTDDPPTISSRPQNSPSVDKEMLRSINEGIRGIQEGIRAIQEEIRGIQERFQQLVVSNELILKMLCEQNNGNTTTR